MSPVRHQLNDDVGAGRVREGSRRFLHRRLFRELPSERPNLRDHVSDDQSGVVIWDVEQFIVVGLID